MCDFFRRTPCQELQRRQVSQDRHLRTQQLGSLTQFRPEGEVEKVYTQVGYVGEGRIAIPEIIVVKHLHGDAEMIEDAFQPRMGKLQIFLLAEKAADIIQQQDPADLPCRFGLGFQPTDHQLGGFVQQTTHPVRIGFDRHAELRDGHQESGYVQGASGGDDAHFSAALLQRSSQQPDFRQCKRHQPVASRIRYRQIVKFFQPIRRGDQVPDTHGLIVIESDGAAKGGRFGRHAEFHPIPRQEQQAGKIRAQLILTGQPNIRIPIIIHRVYPAEAGYPRAVHDQSGRHIPSFLTAEKSQQARPFLIGHVIPSKHKIW